MATTSSGAAFRELLDLLREADGTFAGRPDLDEIAVAEGYRHLTHLLAYAFDLYLEADADRPTFTPLASAAQKILGDNVDSHYWFAPLRGDRAYRLHGIRGNGVYLAFCIYGGKPDGEWSERVVANVSQRDIEFAPDGRFSLILASEPRPGGQWSKLDPDAVCVISREYFVDPRNPRPTTFTIEALDLAPPPPPLSDDGLARRLRAVATFIRETLQVVPLPSLPEPNVIGPPMPWSAYARGWGTPDNVYALAQFHLEPEEALVIEGRSPKCAYWGVQLWNRYMQSLDHRYHRVSINREQAALEPDGSFRVVVAHRDPGVRNWLETAGHRDGLVFCRWLQADELPEQPRSRVVPLDRLRP